jgi:hypothetical protein
VFFTIQCRSPLDQHIEWPQAVDFVDRALFTYERSFIGAFNFTSGQNRLDFDRVENRPFFLAIHRQISYVFFFIYCYNCSPLSQLEITNVVAVFGPHSNLRDSCTLWTRGQTHMARYFISICCHSKPQGCINGSWTSMISSYQGVAIVLRKRRIRGWIQVCYLAGHILGLWRYGCQKTRRKTK